MLQTDVPLKETTEKSDNALPEEGGENHDDPPKPQKAETDDMVRVTGKELGEGMSRKQLRTAARNYARTYFVGKTIQVESAGYGILISQNGVDHSLRMARREDVMHSIVALPDLLRRATLIGTEDDEKKRDYVKAMEIYQTPAEVRGRHYTAEMVVTVAKDESRGLDDIRVLYNQKLKGRTSSGEI